MPENEKPRLRVKKLTIENFRGIDHLELDFTDHNDEPLDLVVVAGSNGVGKTSVLEAAITLLGRSPFDRSTLKSQARFGASDFALSISVEHSKDFVGGGQTHQWQAGCAELSEPPTRTFAVYDGPVGKAPSNELWRKVHLLEPQLEYFSMSRSSDAAREKNLVRFKEMLIKTYYRMLRNKETTSEPFEKLNRMWQFFHGNEQELDVIQLDNNPGSDFEVVIRDSRPIPSNITSLAQARELAPTRDDIPSMVPLDRLSSGQLALLSFAGPLIFRDKPVDFVFIDEPEQHLHVQWQRFLLPALRELAPQAQFFVATHSEEILSSVLSYERFILVESGDSRALPKTRDAAQ